tara:strand:+ start:268 stop:504 length:237 start_codon:yes stop_codon:yes gene_type:complete
MSNKTPFEIRLELLKMAKDLLMDEYFQKVDAVSTKYGYEVEACIGAGLDIPERPTVPYPTESEVIAKAKALNSFVSNG